MDPRDRANALLSHAQARGTFVITPNNATSPMDATSTQKIERAVVTKIDHGDPDSTAVLPASLIAAQDRLAGSPPTLPVGTPQPRLAAAEETATEETDELVPTLTQGATARSSLSRTLDGLD